MKIILANGAELSPINVLGAKRNVQGALRDVLSFVFPADTSLDELNILFTVENCETITVVHGEKVFVHDAYTIRTELKSEPIEVVKATEATAAVYENRVIVSMAQRTYAESQIAALTETVDYLVMESLMSAE